MRLKKLYKFQTLQNIFKPVLEGIHIIFEMEINFMK